MDLLSTEAREREPDAEQFHGLDEGSALVVGFTSVGEDGGKHLIQACIFSQMFYYLNNDCCCCIGTYLTSMTFFL